ncbi:MAG: hypothetical protein AABY01_02650, partial [Nanoarchaeota archaeon]
MISTDFMASAGYVVSLGSTGHAWQDVYASGTAYIGSANGTIISGTGITVGGVLVCLADGTNCPAAGGGGGTLLSVT